jgi:hypothetical protein
MAYIITLTPDVFRFRIRSIFEVTRHNIVSLRAFFTTGLDAFQELAQCIRLRIVQRGSAAHFFTLRCIKINVDYMLGLGYAMDSSKLLI